jgi:hypothetical protein
MKQILKCRRVIFDSPDNLVLSQFYAGKTGVVVDISPDCLPWGFVLKILFDGELIPMRHCSADFRPINTEQIPQTHQASRGAQDAWFFCTLRDEIHRVECCDKLECEKCYGSGFRSKTYWDYKKEELR